MADLPLKPLRLTGWGQTAHTETDVARPERVAELKTLMAEGGAHLARGFGRSYGDAPLVADHGTTILMNRLNRLIAFDEATGELAAEAGVSFAELLDLFGPRGWIVPVSPGTAFVTLGGAIANDVHGKNHAESGTLSRHLNWIDLLLPSGEERRISRKSHAPLFFATIGGIGLTGVILRASLNMLKIPGGRLLVTRQRTGNLEETLAAFNAASAVDPYAVAWLDVLRQGAQLGRGIFERARFIPGAWEKAPFALPMPIHLPGFVLNPLTIGLFNRFHYRFGSSRQAKQVTVPARQFFYPLDRIRNWNRMYGKRGFRQFQAVIPTAHAEAGLRKLLEAIAGSRQGSFLAVLKRLGDTAEGMLSFPLPGFTLALDFPNKPNVGELLAHLEKVTLDHGGRIYLAKDSYLSAAGFRRMYPRLPEFQGVLNEVDPERHMDSLMAQRLKIREAS